MVKLTPEEKRSLMNNGLIDHRGNVRLDSINEVNEVLKRKEEKLRKSFDRMMIAKASQQLLGVKIGECKVIAVFYGDVYLNCFGIIRQVSLDYIIDYIKGVRYVER